MLQQQRYNVNPTVPTIHAFTSIASSFSRSYVEAGHYILGSLPFLATERWTNALWVDHKQTSGPRWLKLVRSGDLGLMVAYFWVSASLPNVLPHRNIKSEIVSFTKQRLHFPNVAMTLFLIGWHAYIRNREGNIQRGADDEQSASVRWGLFYPCLYFPHFVSSFSLFLFLAMEYFSHLRVSLSEPSIHIHCIWLPLWLSITRGQAIVSEEVKIDTLKRIQPSIKLTASLRGDHALLDHPQPCAHCVVVSFNVLCHIEV